jgi:hypothetical protein
VLGRARAEGVGGDELLGAGVELELVPGHAEVGVPAHGDGAVGAVADPRHQARRGLDAPPHAPAVAAAGVYHLGVGGHCVITESFSVRGFLLLVLCFFELLLVSFLNGGVRFRGREEAALGRRVPIFAG